MMKKEPDSLANSPKRQLILTKGILACLFFIGIAIILRQRVDPWLIPLVAVYEALLALFSSRAIAQKMKAKLEINPSLAKTGLIVEGIGLNFGIVTSFLVAIFVLSKLGNPNTYQAGATWLFILAGLNLAIRRGFSRFNPGVLQYLLALFVFINVVLWKVSIVHRKELVVLFALEGILFLIISIYHYIKYDPSKESYASERGKAMARKAAYRTSPAFKAMDIYLTEKYGLSPYLIPEVSFGKKISGTEKSAKNLKLGISIRYPVDFIAQHPDLESEVTIFLQDKYPSEYARIEKVKIESL